MSPIRHVSLQRVSVLSPMGFRSGMRVSDSKNIFLNSSSSFNFFVNIIQYHERKYSLIQTWSEEMLGSCSNQNVIPVPVCRIGFATCRIKFDTSATPRRGIRFPMKTFSSDLQYFWSRWSLYSSFWRGLQIL